MVGLIAPCVFNGAINGELFLAYVEQVLVRFVARILLWWRLARW